MQPKKEIRKVAYDTLLMISSTLKSLPPVDSDAPSHRLFSMVTMSFLYLHSSLAHYDQILCLVSLYIYVYIPMLATTFF